MARVGCRGSYFFTTTQKPTQFKDGRTARGFARTAARFAREKLGWNDAVFDAVPYEDFKSLHLKKNSKGRVIEREKAHLEEPK